MSLSTSIAGHAITGSGGAMVPLATYAQEVSQTFPSCRFVSIEEANSHNFTSFLSSIERIRLVFINAAGFGNLSATFTVYSRLKELGYNKQFEFCFHKKKHYYDLDTIHPEIKEDPKIKLTTIDIEETMSLSYCPLTISGADDCSVIFNNKKLKEYNTGCFIQLNPYSWREFRKIISSTTPFKGLCLDHENGLLYSRRSSPCDLPPSLEQLFKMQDNGECLIISVYGLEDTLTTDIIPEKILNRLENAIKIAAPKKKVVTILHNRVCRYLSRSIQDVLEYLQLYKDDFYKIEISNIPQQLLWTIQSKCSLPPVVEGCNSVTELETSKIPFLHGGGKRSFLDGPCKIEILDEHLDAIQDIHLAACEVLRLEDSAIPITPLAEFIRLCIEKDEKLLNYFELRQQYFLSKSVDYVASALLTAQELEISLKT